MKLINYLVFSDSRFGEGPYLRDIAREQSEVIRALTENVPEELWRNEVEAYPTADKIFDTFRRYRDQIAIFHFAGHANDYELYLSGKESEGSTVFGEGFAAFLSQQKNLRLVFLNGCATYGHVRALLDAGVPAVITTSHSVKDDIACRFATYFYKSLASGLNLNESFEEAEAAIAATVKSDNRQLFRTVDDGVLIDQFPWELYPKRNMPVSVGRWNLKETAGDPLGGLPPLPKIDLPPIPYLHIDRFEYKHAPVFFGRSSEIRQLYQSILDARAFPVILFYGLSGVGKSSLLDAGIRPRVEESHNVIYLRRNAQLGLLQTLIAGISSQSTNLRQAWETQQQEAKPSLIILDQVEECFNQPCKKYNNSYIEIEELTEQLVELFKSRDNRPGGKLILSFREEYHDRIEEPLQDAGINPVGIRLSVLNSKGIQDAILGPAGAVPSDYRESLKRQYRLTILPDVVESIKHVVESDNHSVRAPILQILLRKMWDLLPEKRDRILDRGVYDEVIAQTGTELQSILEEQIKQVAQTHPEEADSGLLLDVLFEHTTDVGTSQSLTVEQIKNLYSDKLERVTDLIETCRKNYLLTSAFGDVNQGISQHQKSEKDLQKTRLTHDVFAPLIRKMYENSDKSGQRARQILEHKTRSPDAEAKRLGAHDLKQVISGVNNMRQLTVAESDLVAVGRRLEVRRNLLRSSFIASVLLLVGMISLVIYFRLMTDQANQQAERQEANSSLLLSVNDLKNKEYFTSTEPFILYQRSMETLARGGEDTKSNSLGLALHKVANIVTKPLKERELAYPRLYSELLLKRMPVLTNILEHKDLIRGAIFDANKRRILSWSFDGKIKLWDVKKGKLLRIMEHEDDIFGVRFNKDESKIFSWSSDRSIRVWETGTGKLIHKMMQEDTVSEILINKNESRIVSKGFDGSIYLWDSDNGKLIKQMRHDETWVGFKLNKDKNKILSWGADNTIRIWDITNGDSILKIIVPPVPNKGGISMAEFGKDDATILSNDATGLSLWNAKNGDLIQHLVKDDDAFDTQFFNGKRRVLARSVNQRTASRNNKILIWKAETGELIKQIPTQGEVTGMEFDNDERKLLVWSSNSIDPFSGGGSLIRLWDLETEEKVAELETSARISRAKFSKDGSKLLLISNDFQIHLWRISTGEVIRMRHESYLGAEFSSDENMLISWSADTTAQLWDSESGELIKQIQHEGSSGRPRFYDNEKKIMSISENNIRLWDFGDRPEIKQIHEWVSSKNLARSTLLRDYVKGGSFIDKIGRRFLSWNGEGILYISDLKTWKLIKEIELEGRIFDVRVVEDEIQVLQLNDKNILRVLNAEENNVIAEINHKNKVVKTHWEQQGNRIMTWDDGNVVRLWNGVTGELISKVKLGKGRWHGAQFSQDANRVLLWGEDNTVRLFNLQSREEIIRMQHVYDIYGAQFDKNESRVLTWQFKSVQLWDADSGELLKQMKHEGFVEKAQFSRDESMILSWGNSVRLWSVETGLLIGLPMRHGGHVTHAWFNQDETKVSSKGYDGKIRVFDLSISNNISNNHWPCYVQARTGSYMNTLQEIEMLSNETWRKLKGAFESGDNAIIDNSCSL